MSITKGIVEWFKTCPDVKDVAIFDVSQVKAANAGIYKQPSVTIENLIDGGQIRTEHYYILFVKDAQIPKDRMDNEEVLQKVEEWIDAQEFEENYPDIGYPVYEIGATNSYYMVERGEVEATYQITIKIKYERTV